MQKERESSVSTPTIRFSIIAPSGWKVRILVASRRAKKIKRSPRYWKSVRRTTKYEAFFRLINEVFVCKCSRVVVLLCRRKGVGCSYKRQFAKECAKLNPSFELFTRIFSELLVMFNFIFMIQFERFQFLQPSIPLKWDLVSACLRSFRWEHCYVISNYQL